MGLVLSRGPKVQGRYKTHDPLKILLGHKASPQCRLDGKETFLFLGNLHGPTETLGQTQA